MVAGEHRVMRAFVSRLAIGLLLAHATFGCGWRHAHADPPPAAAHVESSDLPCCDSHDESPCAPDQQRPTRHCPCHVECQVHCNYVPSERVQFDDQQHFSVPLDGAFVASSILGDLRGAQEVVHRDAEPIEPDSLRRHLLLQVILT